MPERIEPSTTGLIELIDKQLATSTHASLEPVIARSVIRKLRLLESIERKLRATPAGALLLDSELAGITDSTQT